ncbi:hypothetical protein N7475_007762 [Penicillium sp. IBT 31633x]|nr:hypothetical protein N7475_007762 [Penicillium sp. IBT 31633x]
MAGVRKDRSVPAYPHPVELISPMVRLIVGDVDATPRMGDLAQMWMKGVEDGLYQTPIDTIFTLDIIEKAI